MTEKERNDYFYVCSLIEYIARETKNKRGVIASALGLDGLEKQLHDAEVNHCLSFEQVRDELIEQYQIPISTTKIPVIWNVRTKRDACSTEPASLFDFTFYKRPSRSSLSL